MLSFSMSCRACATGRFATGAFFGFFALGGVLERTDASLSESLSDNPPSSSVSDFRFLGIILRVVCTVFLVVVVLVAFAALGALGALGSFAGLAAVAFFAAGFALVF
jgi:hypothetical protein